VTLVVETASAGKDLDITFQAPSTDPAFCIGESGPRLRKVGDGAVANRLATRHAAIRDNAVQTPFAKSNGQASVVIHLRRLPTRRRWNCPLFPNEKRWDNNGGRITKVSLAEPQPPPPDSTRAPAD